MRWGSIDRSRRGAVPFVHQSHGASLVIQSWPVNCESPILGSPTPSFNVSLHLPAPIPNPNGMLGEWNDFLAHLFSAGLFSLTSNSPILCCCKVLEVAPIKAVT